MLEYEWIESQYEEWGYEYVNGLMDRGFVPVKTHRGYRWVFEGVPSMQQPKSSVVGNAEVVGYN